jgi:hypothetical protein
MSKSKQFVGQPILSQTNQTSDLFIDFGCHCHADGKGIENCLSRFLQRATFF